MKLKVKKKLKGLHISIILQLSLLSLAKGQDMADELLKQYQYDIAKEGQTFSSK